MRARRLRPSGWLKDSAGWARRLSPHCASLRSAQSLASRAVERAAVCPLIEPQDEVNIHFTGDAHAVGSAHNLLAALTDNVAQRGQIPGFGPTGITWRRVTDVEDRALRTIVSGVGGSPNAPIARVWVRHRYGVRDYGGACAFVELGELARASEPHRPWG